MVYAGLILLGFALGVAFAARVMQSQIDSLILLNGDMLHNNQSMLNLVHDNANHLVTLSKSIQHNTQAVMDLNKRRN